MKRFRGLTDPGAVDRAIREFDQIGRKAFLAKYSFGEAKSYFLNANGKLYDSKAIVGAAYGFQFPKQGALVPSDFSGGDATVKKHLEKLGFNVLTTSNSVAETPIVLVENEILRGLRARGLRGLTKLTI